LVYKKQHICVARNKLKLAIHKTRMILTLRCNIFGQNELLVDAVEYYLYCRQFIAVCENI